MTIGGDQFDQLISNYAQSGFTNQRLQFGKKPALLVIDLCKAYVTPGSPLYAPKRFDTALKHCQTLVDKCREADIPIIFTAIVYHNNGIDGGLWYKKKIPHCSQVLRSR